jgi:hypothetical protein
MKDLDGLYSSKEESNDEEEDEYDGMDPYMKKRKQMMKH